MISLRWKIFLSYLVVIAIGLAVLALTVSYTAVTDFHNEMGMGMGHGEQNHMGQRLQTVTAETEAAFRQSVNTALWRAGAVAIFTATLFSWLFARQLIAPLWQLAQASQHIARGHYQERLPQASQDELGVLIQNFNQMAQTLAETESLRQQLLADVTHELKTPLASIKGYMEGLQDGVIPATPATFERIHQEASRLERLVKDLQDLSRAEAGRALLNLLPTNPRPLLVNALEQLRPQFEEKGLSVRAEISPNLPSVCIDPDRTHQVIINLLGNALQYTPSGGTVTVHAKPDGAFLQVSIQDTGLGLSPEDLERIFQRFYRVDKSRSRSLGGNGIGLTIARYIVEAQGGRIWATSAGLNLGSCFIFTLPVS